MKQLIVLLFIIQIPLSGYAQFKIEFTKDEMEIIGLNKQIFREHVLKHSTALLRIHGEDDYRLITPAGKLQTKEEVMGEVNDLQVSDLQVIASQMIMKKRMAILIGHLEIKGTFHGKPLPPKIRYMSVFVKKKKEWRLQARSLTPVQGEN